MAPIRIALVIVRFALQHLKTNSLPRMLFIDRGPNLLVLMLNFSGHLESFDYSNELVVTKMIILDNIIISYLLLKTTTNDEVEDDNR